MIAGQVALTLAALFTGAAFYINFAEQPARLRLGDSALLVQWKQAYKRGFIMQSSLAVLGFIFGFWAWWQTREWTWLAGASLMIANWPYTLLGIMPTNRKLNALNPEKAGAEGRALIIKWNGLHSVRTGLGFAATLIFLAGSVP